MIRKHTKDKDKIERQDTKLPYRWAKFTYTSKETNFITKLFKDFHIKIAFKTNNSIGKLLSHKFNHTYYNKLDNSGVYKLTCPNCKMKYIGQTGRSFRTRFKEHYRDFKYNNPKSKFAAHLLDNQHSMGKIDDIMEILHITKKGRKMDTIEKYHIYKETKEGTQINDKNTIKPNKIYEAIMLGESNRGRMRKRHSTGPTSYPI